MSGKSTMKNFKTMLAQAQLPERIVPICLRGDLAAEYEALERQLEDIERQNNSSLDGNGVGEIAEKMAALRALMQEHTYDFRLRALSRPMFRAMVSDHPPRRTPEDEVDDRDRFIGVNIETFFDALIRASLVDPDLDTEDWDSLLSEKLTDKQYDAMSDAAWFLNRGDVDVPFSRAASRVSQSSALA